MDLVAGEIVAVIDASTEGRDIGNQELLIDVVSEADVNQCQTNAALDSNDGMEAIKEAHKRRRAIFHATESTHLLSPWRRGDRPTV